MKVYVDLDKTISDSFYMLGASPLYDYENGKRTDRVLGSRVQIVLPNNNFDKLNVKIKNRDYHDYLNFINNSQEDFIHVYLVNPVGVAYTYNSRVKLSLSADDVKKVDE